jgi:hypothetical protein
VARVHSPTKAELAKQKKEREAALNAEATRIGLLAIDRERWARKVKRWVDAEKAAGRARSINQYPDWDAFRAIEDIYHKAVIALSIDGDEGRGP